MKSRTGRQEFEQSLPHVEETLRSLQKKALPGASPRAEAIQDVLDYTATLQEVVQLAIDEMWRADTAPFALPVDSALHLRAYEGSSNLTADVVEGWLRFLMGDWQPVQPRRAPHGQGQAKSVLNMRASRRLINQVEAAADALVVEKGWPTGRGYKLNARQVAVQWLGRKFPEPAGSESKAAR